jgi:two-component system, LytTR family, response regulator LytT
VQIVIIEDELLIAEMLKELLLDLGHQEVDIATDYQEAIGIIDKKKPNLAFVDIHLGKQQNGFDIASLLKTKYKIPFIFLTSYSDKTTISEAMQFQPHAYLIKPFSEVDIFTTLELIKSREVNEKKEQSIVIKDGTEKIILQVNDILYFRANNIYVDVVTNSKTYLIRTSITKILEDISVPSFERVHRTYAVNLNKVQAVAVDYVLLQGEKIPMSRLHKSSIVSKLKL